VVYQSSETDDANKPVIRSVTDSHCQWHVFNKPVINWCTSLTADLLSMGGHYHECPPQYFWSNISYFLSMLYFLDKLKEFSEFSQNFFFNRM